jgi:hypothetical protein
MTQYIDHVKQRAWEVGHIESIHGRVIHFDTIRSTTTTTMKDHVTMKNRSNLT